MIKKCLDVKIDRLLEIESVYSTFMYEYKRTGDVLKKAITKEEIEECVDNLNRVIEYLELCYEHKIGNSNT